MSREGYSCELDASKVSQLPYDAIRHMPADFFIVTSREVDPATENDLVVWEDQFLVNGYWADIGLGFAITVEAKKSTCIEEDIRRQREALRQTAWQTHEHMRLGCFTWVPLAKLPATVFLGEAEARTVITADKAAETITFALGDDWQEHRESLSRVLLEALEFVSGERNASFPVQRWAFCKSLS